MRPYSILSPSLDGILSDDALYFEGVLRPSSYYSLRDGALSEKDAVILEQYSNDVYNLLLRKLSGFAAGDASDGGDSVKLQALLQEFIKVKGLIAGNGRAL